MDESQKDVAKNLKKKWKRWVNNFWKTGQGAVAMLGMGMRTRTHAADIYLRDSDTDSEKDTATDTWLPLTSFHKMSRLEAVSTIFHFSAPPSALCSNYGWDGMG